MGYEKLSDEDKLEEAIRFVACGQPLPQALTEFLVEVGLYAAITVKSEATCPLSEH